MKGFKRTAKDATATSPGMQLSSTGKQTASALFPGLLAVIGGLVLAAALLWFGLFNSVQQQQQQQLTQAWGGAQAAALQQALLHRAADTRAAARNPELLQAVQSRDSQQLRAAERNLRYWDGVIDAHLNARGEAVQDMGRDAPMNFAALDMLRRAENGQTPAAEAYKIGQRWLVYSVAPLRQGEDQPAQGTLLLAVELNRLLANLPPLPADVGQLQLLQQFGNSAGQVLTQRGQAQGDAQRFESGNPNWQLGFTPGPRLTAAAFSATPPGLATLLALAGALLGLYLVYSGQQRRLHQDVLQLERLVKELSAGKAVKAFSLSLPALDSLVKPLTHLSRHTSKATEDPNSVGSASPAAVPSQMAGLRQHLAGAIAELLKQLQLADIGR